MLDEAVPTTELVNQWIRMCIYGANRVGKTTLGCQFPKPLLLISFEPNATGGAASVSKVQGVIQRIFTSSKQGLDLCKELQATEGKIPVHLRQKWGLSPKQDRFLSYVVDGATSYQDIVLKEIMGWESVPEQLNFRSVGENDRERKDNYQKRAEKTKEGLRPFLTLPGHVVVLAKEKDHNPPKDDMSGLHKMAKGFRSESYFASDIGGGVANWLHDACDYIGRLYFDKEVTRREILVNERPSGTFIEEETGRIVRRLRTMFHPNYAAGFRSANPERVPEFIENPTFEKIYEIIRGE